MRNCFVNAHAKINITLDVLGKRDDGFHELCMIMQSISLHDVVSVRRGCNNPGIMIYSNLDYLPNDERNIAYKTAAEFFNISGIECDGVCIAIEKKIPVAAGLAGGSTDAAAVLKALNTLYDTRYSQRELAEIGGNIGADVPYCIYGGTMLAEGFGERLTRLPGLPDCKILLVKPQFGLSTGKIFNKLELNRIKQHPKTGAVIKALNNKNLGDVCANMYNVLEEVVSTENPEIITIRDKLITLGARGAIMSGSGSTVFGIFDNPATAELAYDSLKRSYRNTYLTSPISSEEQSLTTR